MSEVAHTGEAVDAPEEEVQIVEVRATGELVQERRAGTAAIPAVQAAAAAAGGFVAGAAFVGLVNRRHRRALALAAPRRSRKLALRGSRKGSGTAAELLQIVGSRSLLLDVHLLGGSAGDR
jgi:hypothetical protein